MLMRLSELNKGQSGIIESFEDSHSKIHLMEMGFIIGEMVAVEAIAPLGDPMAVSISGYNLSIRKSEAAAIWININNN